MVAENFEVSDNDTFDCQIMWKLGEGTGMKFCWFFRSVTFVVRFLDRFLGHDVCLSWQWSQGSHIFWKTGTFPRRFGVKTGVVTVVTSPISTANVKCSLCGPIFQKCNGKSINKSHLNNYKSTIIEMFYLKLYQILRALLYQEAITGPLVFFFPGVSWATSFFFFLPGRVSPIRSTFL